MLESLSFVLLAFVRQSYVFGCSEVGGVGTSGTKNVDAHALCIRTRL